MDRGSLATLLFEPPAAGGGGSREECAVGQRPIGLKAHLSSRRILCTTSVDDGPVAEPVGGSHLQNRSRHSILQVEMPTRSKRDKPSSDVALLYLGTGRLRGCLGPNFERGHQGILRRVVLLACRS